MAVLQGEGGEPDAVAGERGVFQRVTGELIGVREDRASGATRRLRLLNWPSRPMEGF